MIKEKKIAILGLGYVGLPLAVGLSSSYKIIGFDISLERISQLMNGIDKTREIKKVDLLRSLNNNLSLTSNYKDLVDCNIFIATVPTPITDNCKPDLRPLKNVCRIISKILKPKDIVVFESTVFPGATEEICGPELEKNKYSLKSGFDFFLGYSPERVNPGDKVHTLKKIKKITSGSTVKIGRIVDDLYSKIIDAGTHLASSIKIAEAAKSIENSQRDINIAFVNELAMMFERMDIPTKEVLAAAQTKWNFLSFQPGLVGGHCIGVDPYYLSYIAKKEGIDPKMILSARETNDNVPSQIIKQIKLKLEEKEITYNQIKICFFGVTFKENVPDIRNSKVADLVKELEKLGFEVDVYDPLANASETKEVYGISLLDQVTGTYAAVVGAVPHSEFRDINPERLLRSDGLLADIKGIWRGMPLPDKVRYWSL